MKVLNIGLLYPPHHRGGYEIVWEGAVRAARARGHEVRVLASDYRASEPRASGPWASDLEASRLRASGPEASGLRASEPEADGLRASGLQAPEAPPYGSQRAPGTASAIYRELRSYLDRAAQAPVSLDLRQRLALERHNAAVLGHHLREFAPDVVAWWGMGGMSLMLIERVRRARIPSVFMVHDTWPDYGVSTDAWTRMTRRRAVRRLAPLLEPLCGVPMRLDLQRAGTFLFNSTWTRDALAKIGFRPTRSAVVTPGVHGRYRAAPARESWGGRLLYVGRLDPVKGVDVILDALALLPDGVSLTLVGSGGGRYEDQLRRQADALGVRARLEMAGPVDPDELPGVYARADAVVFPVRWEEPWGLVPLEAMAVGRPVIATARGGARSYLRDSENALLTPVDDPAAVAAAVMRLAAEPALRRSLREGGLRTASEHTAARFEGQIVEQLERAAAQGSA